MANAPILPLISVDEYLNSSYEYDREYVDGVLVGAKFAYPCTQRIGRDCGCVLLQLAMGIQVCCIAKVQVVA